ncbi:MAG: hypothetical protein KGJ89_01900 [Patescibacteria group bacterium]|nr:hypothetical protein [Patescibacteria group bacterium]MDE2015631.1 hypothetical protein [Patescibacteria group bacterium]MDE2226688.1 hypothetical protein [Patescibacteria group bacterium]
MSIIDDIKSAAEVLRKADNIELYQKLLTAQKQALEIMEENRNLKEENRNLLKKIKIKGDMYLRNDAYWGSKDGKEEGPFCTRCLNVESIPVLLHQQGNPAYYQCPNCKSSIKARPELDQPIVAKKFNPFNNGYDL